MAASMMSVPSPSVPSGSLAGRKPTAGRQEYGATLPHSLNVFNFGPGRRPDPPLRTDGQPRQAAGIDPGSPRLRVLVGELSTRSADFARLWSTHTVRGKAPARPGRRLNERRGRQVTPADEHCTGAVRQAGPHRASVHPAPGCSHRFYGWSAVDAPLGPGPFPLPSSLSTRSSG
ncbi:hypothetical protein [Kitasatospora sp. NPDC059599]|uniref:MmyB family transcriptional regulator n=1 Tax=Kitasatospora sp. NPDC059599 TaxID=3346880 RepID=UPI0036A26295